MGFKVRGHVRVWLGLGIGVTVRVGLVFSGYMWIPATFEMKHQFKYIGRWKNRRTFLISEFKNSQEK